VTSAARMREWRQANPDLAEANARRVKLRARALRILGQRHPDELRAIIAELDAEAERDARVDAALAAVLGVSS
jgi:hypothetical protein